jgi:DNA-directed RNA polymerase specialized sigma24 family protein
MQHKPDHLSGEVRGQLFLAHYQSIARIADYRAWALASSSRFGTADREDIRQELLLHIWKAMLKFDDQRSSVRTFASHLIDRKVASIARYNLAGCRNPRTLGGVLNRSLADEDGGSCEPRDRVSNEYPDRRNVTTSQRKEFWRDIDLALRGVPVGIRRTALALSHSTLAELSRATGQSRTSLYRDIAQIRVALHAAGIGPAYFSQPGSSKKCLPTER